jgi:two-component system, chemotaxis family, sensor kinase CheA
MNMEPQKIDSVRILVADDSLLMRTLVQEALLKTGFQVFTAVNGLEAWDLLQKAPIHLLIADIYMPYLDGLKLTTMIRADEQLRTLPVILMSAIDTDEDRQRGLLCGANDFVVKERRDLESLAARISNLLISTAQNGEKPLG